MEKGVVQLRARNGLQSRSPWRQREYSGRVKVKVPVTILRNLVFPDGESRMVTSSAKTNRGHGLQQGQCSSYFSSTLLAISTRTMHACLPCFCPYEYTCILRAYREIIDF